MIPVAYLVGAAIVTAVVVGVFWKEISAWIKRIWEKLPESVKANLQGAKAFVEKIGSTAKNIMAYYSYNKDTDKWNETIVTKEVSMSEIPDDIRKKVERSGGRAEITEELEKKLELSMS